MPWETRVPPLSNDLTDYHYRWTPNDDNPVYIPPPDDRTKACMAGCILIGLGISIGAGYSMGGDKPTPLVITLSAAFFLLGCCFCGCSYRKSNKKAKKNITARSKETKSLQSSEKPPTSYGTLNNV